jgi:type VI protein secretion system component Hcp
VNLRVLISMRASNDLNEEQYLKYMLESFVVSSMSPSPSQRNSMCELANEAALSH